MAGFVDRLELVAGLDDPAPALARAREAAAMGDSSWQDWLADHAAGLVLIVHLAVSVTVTLADERQCTARRENRRVWLERSRHLPEFEAQLQEVASKDADVLTDELRTLGVPIDASRLAGMAVHVELTEALRADLVAARRRPAQADPAPAPSSSRPHLLPGDSP